MKSSTQHGKQRKSSRTNSNMQNADVCLEEEEVQLFWLRQTQKDWL